MRAGAAAAHTVPCGHPSLPAARTRASRSRWARGRTHLRVHRPRGGEALVEVGHGRTRRPVGTCPTRPPVATATWWPTGWRSSRPSSRPAPTRALVGRRRSLVARQIAQAGHPRSTGALEDGCDWSSGCCSTDAPASATANGSTGCCRSYASSPTVTAARPLARLLRRHLLSRAGHADHRRQILDARRWPSLWAA